MAIFDSHLGYHTLDKTIFELEPKKIDRQMDKQKTIELLINLKRNNLVLPGA